MKLYLSSYQLGDHPEELAKLFGDNKKIGLISNAQDFSTDTERLKQGQREQLDNLSSIGLKPEVIDLREYFGKRNELKDLIMTFAGVWVRGGNTFVLTVAYKKSGFDKIIRTDLVGRDNFVYSGFSAGGCVLQKKLKGIDFVDDPNQVKDAYGSDAEIVWEGVGILDYVFVPHFDSDHPESEDTYEEIKYYERNNIPYKTLRDGEVIIDDSN
jgi:dipeptidase E